jgi:hypothetical protein
MPLGPPASSILLVRHLHRRHRTLGGRLQIPKQTSDGAVWKCGWQGGRVEPGAYPEAVEKASRAWWKMPGHGAWDAMGGLAMGKWSCHRKAVWPAADLPEVETPDGANDRCRGFLPPPPHSASVASALLDDRPLYRHLDTKIPPPAVPPRANIYCFPTEPWLSTLPCTCSPTGSSATWFSINVVSLHIQCRRLAMYCYSSHTSKNSIHVLTMGDPENQTCRF